MDTIQGEAASLVNLGLALSAANGVTITLRGPGNGNWFGVGFDTHVMSHGTYAIVVDGSEHGVDEHNHSNE